MKNFFSVIGNFFKLHKIVAIILCVAIFLIAIWTPVIIVLSKQTKNKNNPSSILTSSVTSGLSVFNAGANSSSASEKEISKGESDAQAEVSSKVESGNKQESSSKTQVSSEVVSSKPKKEETALTGKKIICWGDSITIGMGMARDKCYPAVLQKLLGNDYHVINAGSSGEKSHTIAARQGAYEVFLDKDIVFEEGYGSVDIGGDNDHSLILEDGTKLDINKDGEAFRFNDLSCKKVYIDGKEFELTVSGGRFQIMRDDYKEKLTLKKGSKVVFDSAEKQKDSYCEIFYIGANDGLKGSAKDIEHIVNRYKAMVNRHGNDCYMVITPQWDRAYTDALKQEFGDKAIDLRTEICSYNWALVGVRPTEDDFERAQAGYIPTCLIYKNNPSDTLHLNEYGYEIMANIIYEKGVNLGYWK